MSIITWIKSLFTKPLDPFQRGYRYGMSELKKGASVESLEAQAYGGIYFTDFDLGITQALREWKEIRGDV